MSEYDDMSLEDLKKELDGLKKENMKAELDAEKAKVEERQKEKEKADEEKLRNEIRQDLLKEMKGKSKVDEQKEKIVNDTGTGKWANFKEQYTKSKDMEGLSYDKLCEKAYHDAQGRQSRY